MLRASSVGGAGLAGWLALSPAGVNAQTAGGSFEELEGILQTGMTVVVTDTNGRTLKGGLTGIDDGSLSLNANGRTRTVPRADVSTVRLSDGFRDGALIGAGAGLGAALGILAVLGSRDGYLLPSAKVGAPLLLAGAGALVGALVDRAHEGG